MLIPPMPQSYYQRSGSLQAAGVTRALAMAAILALAAGCFAPKSIEVYPGRAHGTAILFGPHRAELQALMLRFIAANGQISTPPQGFNPNT
jgi:hypothetical protein